PPEGDSSHGFTRAPLPPAVRAAGPGRNRPGEAPCASLLPSTTGLGDSCADLGRGFDAAAEPARVIDLRPPIAAPMPVEDTHRSRAPCHGRAARGAADSGNLKVGLSLNVRDGRTRGLFASSPAPPPRGERWPHSPECRPRLPSSEGSASVPPLEPLQVVVIACSTLLAGLLLGFVGVRIADRRRVSSGRSQAVEIINNSKKEAENIIKAAELATKEDTFKKREALEREAEQKRNELREHERRLEKREDSLEQKEQSVQKKERSLENMQRKLSERKAEVEKRGQDVEELYQKQS